MITPQYILPLADELVIDLFAGGGGASTGIEQAIGRHVDIAINHDPQAVSLHQANHPQTQHHVSDVFEVDPRTVCAGRAVGLLWASPDCTFHSKARGGKPFRDRNRARRRRGLAWVVCHWAREVQPRVIALENVEEFQHWGPLLADGTPCPRRRGSTFQRWVAQLRNLGYAVEWRELRACDYGAPTIRKRLFLVARRDGLPIVWPAPTHAAKPAKGSGLQPWRTAAECIDWSIPCPSIFERQRPLADATLRRIAHGIKRYVLEAAEPYIVQFTHGDGKPGGVQRWGKGTHRIDAPLPTLTTKAEHCVAVPTLIQAGYGERPARWRCLSCRYVYEAGDLPTCGCTKCGSDADPVMIAGQAPRVPGLDKPLGTAVGANKHALVAALLAKHFGGEPQAGKTAADLRHPAPTVLASGGPQAVVTSHLAKLRGTSHSAAADAPLGTISAQGEHHALVSSHLLTNTTGHAGGATDAPLHTIATGGHHAEVRALLLKYYGTDQDPELREPLHTVTTKDRFGLVAVQGELYAIADIGMRMLQPRELYRAQGFPDSYVIEHGADGRPLSKAAQVRMCGNSVCPPLARAIVAANYIERAALREAA